MSLTDLLYSEGFRRILEKRMLEPVLRIIAIDYDVVQMTYKVEYTYDPASHPRTALIVEETFSPMVDAANLIDGILRPGDRMTVPIGKALEEAIQQDSGQIGNGITRLSFDFRSSVVEANFKNGYNWCMHFTHFERLIDSLPTTNPSQMTAQQYMAVRGRTYGGAPKPQFITPSNTVPAMLSPGYSYAPGTIGEALEKMNQKPAEPEKQETWRDRPSLL